MPRPITPASRLAAVALAVLATTAGLAGCTPDPGNPGETDPPQATDGPAPTGSPTAVPTPEPTEEPIPFEIACDALLTPDQVYEFNPNFGTAPDYQPSARGVRDVVGAEGTACGWSNQTSGEVIEVGVATLPPAAFDLRVGEAAMSSNPVPTYGTPPDVEGFFLFSGGVGEAQAFTGEQWIVVASEVFLEPGDAQQLVAAVMANLP